MGVKIKTPQKCLGLKTPPPPPQKKKQSLDQKLTPKVSHVEFPSNKNSQRVFNDMTQKIETPVMERLCLFQSSQH